MMTWLKEFVFNSMIYIGLITTTILLGLTIYLIIYTILPTKRYYKIKFDAFRDKDCTAIIKAKNIAQAEIKFYRRYKCECKISSIEVM